MASAQPTPSTPPPSSRLRSPPTPKHGAFSDDWDPYSPRKSARLSARKAAIARTPSPSSSRYKLQEPSPRASKNLKSSTFIMASPPKKCAPAASTRNGPDSLATLDHSFAASPRSLKPLAASGMLPTPAKTPNMKRQHEATDAPIDSVSRNIFRSAQDDEVRASPRKRRNKQYDGISLESFTAIEVSEDIPVHVDSRDRIPESNDNLDNLFSGPGATRIRSGATNTRSFRKRALVNIPGESAQTVDQVIRDRDDGLVYVFRGKKKFRKFAASDPSERPSHPSGEISPLARVRTTRSSITPRLLFPRKSSAASPRVDYEEEAPTDIEGDMEESHEDSKATSTLPDTPADKIDELLATPKAPRFAPVSPPTTGRAVRSKSRALGAAKATRGAKGSIFNSWPQTKNGARGQKRRAESSGQGADAKRARI